MMEMEAVDVVHEKVRRQRRGSYFIGTFKATIKPTPTPGIILKEK
jgi:hypothetical protein